MENDDEYESLPANTPLGISMAAGAAAGILEHTIMYPVDAIKTRMQVGPSNITKGIVSSLSSVSATEGAFALWRGMWSVVLGAGPAHALHFAVYEGVISTLNENGHDTNSPLVSAIAGASATICNDGIMTPFDVIKQRMQLIRSGSLAETAHHLWRNEGLRAFYVSYPTTLVMNIPFHAMNFTVYDSCSHVLNPERRHDPLIHCVSGGIAGATAAAISTPFDVIKTRLQTRGVAKSAAARDLSGFFQAAKYVYTTEGWQGFLRGLRPRVVANMPSTAICWTVYEMAKHYLLNANAKK